MRTIIKQVSFGGLTAIYRQDEAGTVELLLLPSEMEGSVARDDCAAEPLVQFKLLGGDSPAYFSGGRTMRGMTPALKLAEQREERDGDSAAVTTVLTDTRGIRCIHTLTLFAPSGTAEVRTAFCNDTNQPLTLEMLSSFTLGSLSPFSGDADGSPDALHLERGGTAGEQAGGGAAIGAELEELLRQQHSVWQCG